MTANTAASWLDSVVSLEPTKSYVKDELQAIELCNSFQMLKHLYNLSDIRIIQLIAFHYKAYYCLNVLTKFLPCLSKTLFALKDKVATILLL
ncbi:hypothetical protein T4D_8841 [Trichinella pseudospiralis]|uniref:Uncharacterized protein n=1 Tax=Trichinella pseudospiralis TaxID=6337 RepID=A0A0V1FN34_TRIPS|nr:hypothetical protein T4D_8841 [Trichinella pseudospiralis]